jgi:hypothetical protein
MVEDGYPILVPPNCISYPTGQLLQVLLYFIFIIVLHLRMVFISLTHQIIIIVIHLLCGGVVVVVTAYPTALNECFAVYQWVVDGRLGIRPSRIILAGDSAGGNLAVATCLKAIMEHKRTPDGMVLAYPILNLRQTPTPSRYIFLLHAARIRQSSIAHSLL